ncbi:hypothetical protein DY000_02048955 [Brassica cretica]|uniref:Uncharacterized protein n=1 Tax=Brassica cretica TaxID=69181 RepID=A0ABQ7EXQ0_BRACR|nr:hypothetical protein DY000_02048955 [Brassica cretica]
MAEQERLGLSEKGFKDISVAAAGSPMDGCKSRKCAQQKKLEAEENTENIPMSAFFKQSMHELEDVTDDVDGIEILSQLDYHVSEKEEKLLLNAFFHKDVASIAKRLSEAITSSINKLEDKHIAATYEYPVLGSACISATDYYRKLGEFMSLYTHDTMYKATNMFASGSKVERFYEIFLLPRSCTIPEAVIIGSIIQKFLFLKIYQAIPEKKYVVAHLAIDAVAAHFLRFRKETKVMLVIFCNLCAARKSLWNFQLWPCLIMLLSWSN